MTETGTGRILDATVEMTLQNRKGAALSLDLNRNRNPDLQAEITIRIKKGDRPGTSETLCTLCV